MKKIIVLFILIFVVFAACNNGSVAPHIPGSSASNVGNVFVDDDNDNDLVAKNFNSEEEFLTFVKMYGGKSSYSGRSAPLMDMAFDGSNMAVKSAGMMMESASVDFSETNVQVQGIDEGDIIKTDGEFIYTISDKNFFIVKAYPGDEAEIVYEETFDQRPSGMFIQENKVLVYGRVEDYSLLNDTDFDEFEQVLFTKIYDVSNKNKPSIVKENFFEGRILDSRMIGNEVYIVSEIGREFDIARPFPIYYESGMKRSVNLNDMYYFGGYYTKPEFVSVQSIDIATGKPIDVKVIAVDGRNQIYMSENALYLALNGRINTWNIDQLITRKVTGKYLTEKNLKLIEDIENIDSDILSTSEKKNKIMNIYYHAIQIQSKEVQKEIEKESELLLIEEKEKIDYEEYVMIHKIIIEGNGVISVGKTAKIPGNINNQFSLDEYDNVLRVATTIGRSWWLDREELKESQNAVFTLDNDMKILDSLMGLGKDERIYSTRYVGEKLYMVTFKQIDPFFVIDLSNPAKIKTLGKLKIPGFSKYLHPYDKNTIIGIGKEASGTGRTQGLKISLFDVEDPENPVELSKFVTEAKYASSTSLYEHKAFLFSKEKNLLVIPAYNWDYQNDEGYNGAFVFNITKDEITLRGLIDHGVEKNYYGASVERSLYINDLLYTKSNSKIRINQLSDLMGVKDVFLRVEKVSDINVPVY